MEDELRAATTRPEPVRRIPGDPERDEPGPGIGLCLSGGGYRAMLFHVGALWRLNELGYLRRLDRVSSVSGGSIAAGVLALAWGDLAFDEAGVARRFVEVVATPLHRLADRTLDRGSIVGGILTPRKSVSDKIVGAYRAHLFGRKTLQDFPDYPRFVVNATNLQSAVLWRFSKPYMWDYRVGKIEHPRTDVAVAVAASSAFPPFLSPLVLDLGAAAFVPGTGHDLQQAPYTERAYLCDGGVYDNLGLETVWKRLQTVLVSDGGGLIRPEPEPKRDWVQQSQRVLSIIDSQVRSLRKRQVVGSYVDGTREGVYWGIHSHIADYPADDKLPCPPELTRQLAAVPTRLAKAPERLQQQLVNWGYAVCDAGIRSHVLPDAPRPESFPYGDAGVG